jgi:hypothetical protein
MEMPRWRSSSIQSEREARWFLRAVTEPASCTAPPYRRNFSVNVVFPASGCEIIANVLLGKIPFISIKLSHKRDSAKTLNVFPTNIGLAQEIPYQDTEKMLLNKMRRDVAGLGIMIDKFP